MSGLKKFCSRVLSRTLSNTFSSHGKFPPFPAVTRVSEFPADLLHEKIISAGQLSAILYARAAMLNIEHFSSDALDLVTRNYPTEVIGAGECGALAAKVAIAILTSEEFKNDDDFKLFDEVISDVFVKDFCARHGVETPKENPAHRFVGMLHTSQENDVMVVDPFFKVAISRQDFFASDVLFEFYLNRFGNKNLTKDFLRSAEEAQNCSMISTSAQELEEAKKNLSATTAALEKKLVISDPTNPHKSIYAKEIIASTKDVLADFHQGKKMSEEELRKVFSWVNQFSLTCSSEIKSNRSEELPTSIQNPIADVAIRVGNKTYLGF